MRYDHVVVGAGSAGAPLAALLAEGGRTVLLLDAGPDERSAATPAGIAGPDVYAALAVPGRRWADLVTAGPHPCAYLRGRGVGGSSAINGMLAEVGRAADYDAWGDGWTWAEVAPAMARAARRLGVRPASVDAAGVIGGATHAAASALGLASAAADLTWDGARRVSTNDAYLEPARALDALHVRGDAEVARVLLRGDRATGVVLAGGEVIEAAEVVVSAGSIGTPLLLLRSGVSTPGVGAHLVDHAATNVVLHRREPHAGGLVISTAVRAGDITLLPLEATGADAGGRAYGAVLVTLLAARTEGAVTLSGDRPVVRFALLDDERDRRALRAGVRLAIDLVAHTSFAPVVDDVFMDADGTRPAALATDDALDAWLPDHLGGVFHAAGTCRLGAVVDPDGGVRGYRGLRVADASIMRALPHANPHLTCVMIGERMAELILA